jgi:tetratricopeptide (TPR) repeat protein
MVLMLGLLVLLIAPEAPAQTPARSPATDQVLASAPGLRTLTGADAKNAEEFDKPIAAAMKADRWDEAIARAEELLALRTRAQGPKHFETAKAEWRRKALRLVAPMAKEDCLAYQSTNGMNEQAEILFAEGKYAQAQLLFEKALGIRRRLLTNLHPDTTLIYNNLAITLNAQGKYRQAQTLLQKVVEINPGLLTELHPVTASA